MLQQVNWPPHITVAAVVADGDRYLMVEEEQQGELVINQPAGHLEPEESLFEAARRETLEETGWIVELTGFVGFYQYQAPDALFHRFAFSATAIQKTEQTIDADITAVHWLTLDEIRLRPQRSPMVVQCIEHAMNTSLPLDLIHEHFGEQ